MAFKPFRLLGPLLIGEALIALSESEGDYLRDSFRVLRVSAGLLILSL